MKIAIVGCCGHYHAVLRSVDLRSDLELVSFSCGTKEENCESFLKGNVDKYGLAVYDNYIEMLDAAKPDIVVASSQFSVNSTISREAMKRGMHCYCEKPAALNLADLELLRNTYEKSGVQFAAMLELRCNPAFQTAYRKIKEGVIGEVLMVTSQKSYKLGQRADFYKKRETYGGTIPWVGIHCIDWVRWLSGKEILSVQAYHDTRYNSGHEELETTALCLFELQGGGFASSNIDYLRPSAAKSHGDDRARVAGSKGVIEVTGGKAYIIDAEGERELPLVETANLFNEFVDQIQGKGLCSVSAEDSFRMTEIVLKARQSADEGRKILI